MIGIGNNTSLTLKLGSNNVAKAYVGSTQVYPNATPVIDYSIQYLTFEVVTAGTITIKANSSSQAKTISYSTDDGSTWTDLTTSTTAQNLGTLSAGNKVLVKGTNAAYSTNQFYYNQFGGTARVNVYGNIMSLVYGDDFAAQTTLDNKYTFNSLFYNWKNLLSAENLVLPTITLTDYCYYNMFYGCTSLTTAPTLPATAIAKYCYSLMFRGCTRLANAVALPATTLAEGCYIGMFQDCTNLTTAPVLSATTLANSCYRGMFSGCTSLTTAPELPATTLSGSCYIGMFQDCTNLTTAPELPATTLSDSCYQEMFKGCTSLTVAPELPATTLAYQCYRSMFSGTNVLPDCTNIDFTSAIVLSSGGLQGLFEGTKVTDSDLMNILPKNSDNKYYLPATTLVRDCYSYMFNSCKNLVTAPELPATTLKNKCYYQMFSYCTSLTTAPKLPATTLAENCCYYMFAGCTSLTTAPELPATTLVYQCYYNMFKGCTNLNYIKCLATDISAANCTYNWVNNVAASGTFVKAASMSSWTTGKKGIPEGWTVETASN